MTITLTKGQKINLSKKTPFSKHLSVGLGWDPNEITSDDFDPDASAFLLDSNKKCTADEDFIFYNNLVSSDQSVQHTGDDRTGGTSENGPDEIIKVDLSKISSKYERIDFVVTIFEAIERRQNFGQISNIFINIVDDETGKEILRYDLTEDFANNTSIVFGSLVKSNKEWSFEAIGKGSNKDLGQYVNEYGLNA